ncbi:MAG: hypothetical protein AMXMBFR64_24930 [Myxococcales bacterium]
MRKTVIIVAVLLVALAGGAWLYLRPTELKPPPQGAALDEALASGEVILETEPVEGTTTPRMKLRAVIDAPPEKVWAIIEDCGRYEETMIRMEESEELSREGDTVVCRGVVDMPFPLSNLTATTKATHTVEPQKLYRRAWTMVEGDYKRNEGSWTLTPYNGDARRTLVDYQIVVEPDIEVPDSVRIAAQQKALPDLIEKLREQVR